LAPTQQGGDRLPHHRLGHVHFLEPVVGHHQWNEGFEVLPTGEAKLDAHLARSPRNPALASLPICSSLSIHSSRYGFSASTIDSRTTRLRYHFAFAGTTVHGACFAAVLEI